MEQQKDKGKPQQAKPAAKPQPKPAQPAKAPGAKKK
jgi:hypothetical protein